MLELCVGSIPRESTECSRRNEVKKQCILWQTQRVLDAFLGLLSSDSSSQLNVLGHDRDSLGVDRTEISVFKETNEISFRSFLQRKYGGALESKVTLEVLSNLSNESLERQLANQQLRRLLELSNLSQGDSSWSRDIRDRVRE